MFLDFDSVSNAVCFPLASSKVNSNAPQGLFLCLLNGQHKPELNAHMFLVYHVLSMGHAMLEF